MISSQEDRKPALPHDRKRLHPLVCKKNSLYFFDADPFFDVGLIIKMGKQPDHGQFVPDSVSTPPMVEVPYGQVTQSDHELNQLKLGQLFLPSGSLSGLQGTYAIVVIQKHVNNSVHAKCDRDRWPPSVRVGVFTHHQNAGVMIHLQVNLTSKLISENSTILE